MKSIAQFITESKDSITSEQLTQLKTDLEGLVEKILPNWEVKIDQHKNVFGDGVRVGVSFAPSFTEPDKKYPYYANGYSVVFNTDDAVLDLMGSGKFHMNRLQLADDSKHVIPFRKNKPSGVDGVKKNFEKYLLAIKKALTDKYDELLYNDENFPKGNLKKSLGI